MLKKLKVNNFALLKDITAHFDEGLNIIMGETGAGKSMLISALEVLFGGRSSVDSVRRGEQKAVVEAEFYFRNPNILTVFFNSNEFDSNNNSLLLRREILSKGGSRGFINDTPATAAQLREISNYIIDFHGQHEHQSLLLVENHLKFIDLYDDIATIKKQYESEYNNLVTAINELKDIKNREKYLKEQLEYNQFKLNEILLVNPEIDEDTKLEAELKILENVENINIFGHEISNLLYDNEGSAYNSIHQSMSNLKAICEYNLEFTNYIEELKTALISVKEIAESSKEYINSLEYNPERIEEIRRRLSQLKSLVKKYGSIDFVIKEKERLEKDLEIASDFDFQIESYKRKISTIKNNCGEFAKILSKARRKVAKYFSANIEDKLINLNIENAKFEVKFNLNESNGSSDTIDVHINEKFYKADATGIDQVEFFISTNLGEDTKPLVQIASGGEISRIMLAIKSLIAKNSTIAIFVFDEIDTGISGKVAQKTGFEMKKIAQDVQIISITHLPQIAALGDNNILVEKFEENETTWSQVRNLPKNEKIIEVAKLLGDGNISEVQIRTAEELMNINL